MMSYSRKSISIVMSCFNTDSLFDSFVYNELKIFSDPLLQNRVWVVGDKNIVCEFEDNLADLLESSEALFEQSNHLSKERHKYLKDIKKLSEYRTKK